MAKKTLFHAGASTSDYYRTMNKALKSLNGDYRMLHYPLFVHVNDDFIKAQENLTEHCINLLPDMKGKSLLDIGCGNGVQTMYIHEKVKPDYTLGIDLNEDNIQIGLSERDRLNLKNIDFRVDNAQTLETIADNSFEGVVNIESAFHYPDKDKFLEQIARVLKPGGYFVIADILNKPGSSIVTKSWKGKMHLNHWTKEHYEEALKVNNLVVETEEDLTNRIIDGFENVRDFKVGDDSGIWRKAMLNIFFRINVRLNIRLLKKKRQYYIFKGYKA